MGSIEFIKALFTLRVRRRVKRLRRLSVPSDHSELIIEWTKLRAEYFPHRKDLDSYRIVWSGRYQKRTLASCNITKRLVKVAQAMQHPNASPHLSAVLYHELCHAALGHEVEAHRGRRMWHGPSFKNLEARHPGIIPLKNWMRTGGWHQVATASRRKSKGGIGNLCR